MKSKEKIQSDGIQTVITFEPNVIPTGQLEIGSTL